MNESEYVPISCGFHDRLEDFAVRRAVVPVVALSPDGAELTFDAVITDVFARDGADWATFALAGSGDNVTIRLDRIRSVDGIDLPTFC